MVNIARLNPHTLDFPATEFALEHPNGLLAIGGDLSADRLLRAYRRGIFPWYEDPQPILWWTPDPRSVLFPSELSVSRSLRRTARRCGYTITFDQVFHEVIAACAAPRRESTGTWITNTMARAYMQMFRAGHAHSVEVWDPDRVLVGGLYGVAMAPVFFGESMFSHVNDASKLALLALVHVLKRADFQLIDCQVESEHLNSLGARNISRLDFEALLTHTSEVADNMQIWQCELSAEELV